MTTNVLLSRYDALLSDLDGVVYAGPFAIEAHPKRSTVPKKNSMYRSSSSPTTHRAP